MTVYYNSFPPSLLETVADLESDRMGQLCLDEKNLESERKVVMEERRVRIDNFIPGKMLEQLFENAYESHPYQWPVVGRMSDIKNIKLEECLEYYKTYYAPNNAVLVIAGDFNIENAIQLIEKYYNPVTSQKSPNKCNIQASFQNKEKRVSISQNAQLSSCMIGYRVPGIGDSDIYSFDILKIILAVGESSRIYRHLLHEKELIISIWCDVSWRIHDSLFMFYI